VVVPATSANLGPGFDALGLALALYDEVTVQVLDQPGLSVEVSGEGADVLARDETHLVVRAIVETLKRLGANPPGLSVRCTNGIPQGRGLGSSAAAIVAGVLAAASLADGAGPADRAGLLAVASEMEGHPDNVAACLLGGFTIAWTEHGHAHAVRLEPSPQLAAMVFLPADGMSTVAARGLLPQTVPHRDAAHAAGRAALAVAALTTRPDLLLPATEDRLHQSYRAPAMAATAELVERLRAAGAAAVVSGAGPAVVALLPDDRPGPADLAGAGWTVQTVALDLAGARVVDRSSPRPSENSA
jgi:homoserine kinase